MDAGAPRVEAQRLAERAPGLPGSLHSGQDEPPMLVRRRVFRGLRDRPVQDAQSELLRAELDGEAGQRALALEVEVQEKQLLEDGGGIVGATDGGEGPGQVDAGEIASHPRVERRAEVGHRIGVAAEVEEALAQRVADLGPSRIPVQRPLEKWNGLRCASLRLIAVALTLSDAGGGS